jgi:hypothetical protein
LIDPTTEPCAWKSLRETAALKLSTVDMGVGVGEGVGEGEGDGVGEGVGTGVGARVGSGKNGLALPTLLGVTAVPPHAATEPKRRTTAVPRARRRMQNKGISRFLAALDSRAATRKLTGRCIDEGRVQHDSIVRPGRPTQAKSACLTSGSAEPERPLLYAP